MTGIVKKIPAIFKNLVALEKNIKCVSTIRDSNDNDILCLHFFSQ